MSRRVTKLKPATPKTSVASGSLAPQSSALNRSTWLLAALLALITMALYWPAMRHDFVNYDDDVYVTANVQVQAGLTLQGLKWAFFDPGVRFGYWHPLTLLSHMLDCQLYGLSPWGHHLTSVLLHALNTALVFLLLRSLTGAVWRSAMVAALFGWHPAHVESVAWVAERKDVLSTFFGLLTLMCYARYAQLKIQNAKLKIWHGLALVFFACGLMSKPMLVTLPFVMLLLDYWPLGRIQNSKFKIQNEEGSTRPSTLNSQPSTLRQLVWEKTPFFVLVAVMSGATFVLSKQGGALAGNRGLPFGPRLGNALISYCRYLGKLFWPENLSVFYPHPAHWPMAEVIAAGGFLTIITVLFFVGRRPYPFLLTGWLWFMGMLVPVIGLLQVGEFSMADRYMYLPSLGLLIVVVWGAYELTRRWRYQVMGLSVAGSAAIVLCLGLTRQQLGYWRDSETLFRHALEVTENNHLAHNNLGTALAGKSRLDEAIGEFQEAIRLRPAYVEAHYNLGNALDKQGRTGEAILQYQEAIGLQQDYADTHNDLRNSELHNNLGKDFYNQGRMDEATSEFQEAIRLRPDFADAHKNLGLALARNGQMDEATSQFQEAILLDPQLAEAHNYLGNALIRKGETDDAIDQYQEAVRLKPDLADFHNSLGIALAMKGRMDEAISEFQEALRLDPDDTGARDNLARALAMKNTAPGKAEPSNH